MISTLFHIFFISFLINLFWEVLHSQLYETCLKAPLKEYIPLIIWASVKDGFWISLFYLFSFITFGSENILLNYNQLFFFIILSLIFAWCVEKNAIRLKRWEYSKQMPILFGVGITPLLELAVTGILTFCYVFLT